MKLYHYATSKFPLLKTLDKQKKITPEERKRAEEQYAIDLAERKYVSCGLYFNHISFFLERPPLDKMSTFFDDHYFWYKGHHLFEYVVESESIGKFDYWIVEHPDKNKLYYNDSVGFEEYDELMAKIDINKKYKGSGNDMLLEGVKNLHGDINKYFGLIKKRPNFELLNTLYAGTVPHVQIFPEGGVIRYEEVNTVVIG